MKKRAILCLALGAAGLLTGTAAEAQVIRWDSYAVKFVCGAVERGPFEDAVDGKYKTTVNIHNPNYLTITLLDGRGTTFPIPVVYYQKIVLAPHQGEPRLPHSCFILEILDHDEARSVNCDNIKQQLAVSGLPSTGPLDGYVVLLVPPFQDPEGDPEAPELDVTGVYSARSRAPFIDIQMNGAAAFDVEDIEPTQVVGSPASLNFCS